MVLKRNATLGWQIKKLSRRQLINGAWRTCSDEWKMIDQEQSCGVGQPILNKSVLQIRHIYSTHLKF